uniref:Uncharacterized protein n=2 Tax=Human herpesvirus 2 TaxID=10310 RepID=A0A481THZ1_HHV2|nr:hypothetical protein [Human alphaherpesvirus 2]
MTVPAGVMASINRSWSWAARMLYACSTCSRMSYTWKTVTVGSNPSGAWSAPPHRRKRRGQKPSGPTRRTSRSSPPQYTLGARRRRPSWTPVRCSAGASSSSERGAINRNSSHSL